MKQIFHRAHRLQQLPWPSWLRRSLSKREIMSSNLIGSIPFWQNDMAFWIALRPQCHCCHLAAQTFSMWRLIDVVSVKKLSHACQLNVPEVLTRWPRNLTNVGLVPLDRIHTTRKSCKWTPFDGASRDELNEASHAAGNLLWGTVS